MKHFKLNKNKMKKPACKFFALCAMACLTASTAMATAEITVDGTTTTYDNLAAAANAAKSGQTITLTSDETISKGVTLGGVSLDLGGYTVTCNNVESAFQVGGTVTLKNGKIELKGEEANTSSAIATGYSPFNLDLYDLEISGGASLQSMPTGGSNTINIHSGTYGGAIAVIDEGAMSGGEPQSKTVLNIYGGTFSPSGDFEGMDMGAVAGAGITTNIYGGTFNGAINNGISLEGENPWTGGSANISGGTFNGVLNNQGGTFSITGGTFSATPDASYLATGYNAVATESGYTVTDLSAEALPKYTTTTGDDATQYALVPTKTDDTYTFDITDDGSFYSLSNASDLSSTVNLNYTRTFQAVGWYSWFMPFTFKVTDALLEKVKFAVPMALMNAGEDNSEWRIAVVVVKPGDDYTTVNANTPYFIKPLAADGTTATTLSITGVTLKATDGCDLDISNTGYNMHLIGNYANNNFKTGWWSLSTNGSGFIQVGEDDGTPRIPSMRFYMTMSKKASRYDSDEPSSTGGAKPNRISIVEFDDEATAIAAINQAVERGSGKVYDLQGRRVTKPVRGIYIMDGKKVLVK